MAEQKPVTIKYQFKDTQSGQISEGYTVIDINDHEAEVSAADEAAMLLAEKHGGELVTSQGKAPVNPDKFKAQRIEKAVEQTRDFSESDLTKAVETGELTTPETPRLSDPVARQQQEK